MLMPRRVKHRKQQRGRMSGIAKGGSTIAFGDYALMTEEPGYITSRQIEAARRAMTRYVRRGGKIWIRIFPDKPVTKKPAEVRMGKGKGAPDHWVAVVKPGRILFEMAGVPHSDAVEAMRLASHKLPVERQVPGPGGGPRWRSLRPAALSEQELGEELESARRHLYDLRFQLATRQLTDYSQISQTRRDIARLLTVQTERQLEPASAGRRARPPEGSR